MISIETLNGWSEWWMLLMADRLAGSTVVFLFACAVWYFGRQRLAPWVGVGLFLLVLVKLVNPMQPFGVMDWSLSPETHSIPVIKQVYETPLYKSQGIDHSHKEKINSTFVPPPDVYQSVTPQPGVIPLSFVSWVMVAWMAVVMALLIRFVYCEWYTRIMVRTAKPYDGHLPIELTEVYQALRMRRPIPIVTADWVRSPFIAGILMPKVFVQRNFTGLYSPEEIRWILLHEFTHIKRFDPVVKLFQTFVQILFFFHPAVWISNRMIDRLREFACDDAAIQETKSTRQECGEGFLRMVLQANAPLPLLPGVVHPLQSKKIIKERLMRILDNQQPIRTPLNFRLTLLILVCSVALMSFGVFSSSALAPNPQSDETGEIASEQEVEEQDFNHVGDVEFDVAFDIDVPVDLNIDIDVDVDDIAVAGIQHFYSTGDFGDGPIRGLWSGMIRDGKLQLGLTYRNGEHKHQQESTYSDYRERFEGLEAVGETTVKQSVAFQKKGDAGTISFTGQFDNGLGTGTYDFQPNPEFVKALEKAGYEGVKDGHLFIFTEHDFKLSLVTYLEENGYGDLTLDSLMEFCIFGVDEEYIRGLEQAGFAKLPAKQLVEMRIHNVTVEYIDSFRDAGYKDLTAKNFVEMKIHGVSIELAKTLSDMGYGYPPAKQLVELRIHGATPEYIKEMTEFGFTGLTLKDFATMRIHNVTTKYIEELSAAGYKDLSADQLVQMRIHNVNSQLVSALTGLGYEKPTAKILTQLSIHNVTPDYINRFAGLGYKQLPLQKFVEMKIHNVKPEFVLEMKELGYSDIPVNHLVNMRIHNVQSDFVGALKELGYPDVPVNQLVNMRIHNVTVEFIKSANEKEGKQLSIQELVNKRIHGS